MAGQLLSYCAYPWSMGDSNGVRRDLEKQMQVLGSRPDAWGCWESVGRRLGLSSRNLGKSLGEGGTPKEEAG